MKPVRRSVFLRQLHAALCLCVLLWAPLGIGSESNPVRIGVLAWQGLEEAEVHWSELSLALEARLPGRRIRLQHSDLNGMAAALAAGELDFVVTNPGHYVMLEASNGISRIATQVANTSTDPDHVVGSAVVVRADRQELQQLTDLRGHTLAAVSPDAFGGYQIMWGELRRLGLDPELNQPRPLFTDFPMSRVLEAVLQGKADAGILRACLLEYLEREGTLPPGQLRVLSPRPDVPNCQVSSRLYPGWAFAAAPRTPPALSREVLLALLSLAPDSHGQSWSVPADYYPVHALLRELEIGPYAFLRETGSKALFQRYWPWALGLMFMLLIWGIYTLHVEHLVKRRTRELSQALDERQQLEARVMADQEQMEHLSRLSILGELSGTLAHELNQPLATMGNYARSLLRRQASGKLTADALEQAANEIANESERAAAVLGGIRALAKKRQRVREIHDLAELVHEAGQLLHGMQPSAPEIQLSQNLPPTQRQVCVDPLQIQQVLLNLFKNAWDAQQAAQVSQPIQVGLEMEGDYCSLCVRDQGTGLPEEQLAHLFEPFFTTKPDGLGLGLSICKTIVEAHGGHLSARPAQPGLVLCFTLPLAPE